ncbi:UNVERIFIED_CONTAM: hypothetical protein Sradi_0886800 [Sesamum radiatum]|uniref:Uncharacterized protein n=1 Tax=Sesamum radiatum TaxID=300843 RepID=A0AAW2V198_SESRA
MEESNALDPSIAAKRKGRDEEKEPKEEGGTQALISHGLHALYPLNAFRGEILVVVEQQGLINQ